jgi:hypothetical protein
MIHDTSDPRPTETLPLDEARVAASKARARARLGAKFDPVPEELVDFLIEPSGSGVSDDKIDVLLDGEIDMVLNGEVDVDLLLEAARARPEDGSEATEDGQ